MNNYIKPRVKRLRLLHQYYSYTGFYNFVGTSLKKALIPISIFIFGILLINRYFIDLSQIFSDLTFIYSPFKILLVFFTSESFLGLIPPEIFIAWSNKTSSPIFYLTILALLSYLGGIVSFFIGRSIAKLPSVYNYLEVKMKKHLKNIKKWGGFLIVVGALLPIPFSMTSIAAGTINYNFKYYLLFGLLRFARFYLYALAIYHIF